MSPASPSAPRTRGRPAGASRDDVLAAATATFLAGRKIDVRALAAELGVSRATLYRWFGDRDGLVGEVLIGLSTRVVTNARRATRKRGAAGLLDVFDRVNRNFAESAALRRFVQDERAVALRIITGGGGTYQPRMVELISGVIEAEVEAGRYQPPTDPGTLGYAIVRLAEAFLFNDATLDVRGDVERLREVEAALLGVRT